MSDMSVLSHEYKTASDLSQHISTALILLKKVYYHLPGGEAVMPEQLDSHLLALADMLTALVGLLTIPRPQNATSAHAVSIRPCAPRSAGDGGRRRGIQCVSPTHAEIGKGKRAWSNS